MNATVREWIDKAGGDYATAGRELQATSKPNFDAVCYHAQQCIEKLMKGLLIHLGVVPHVRMTSCIWINFWFRFVQHGLRPWKTCAS